MAIIDGGSSTAGKANVDANYNLNVNLPLTASQAGYAQKAFVPVSTISKVNRISEFGAEYSAEMRQILDIDFNSATANWINRILVSATTMTRAVTSGFFRLNNSAITTTTTGISFYTCRTITIEPSYDYRISAKIRHTNGAVTNKQAEFGLGYYNFAAGQANAMNEFIGFRWNSAGALLGVISTSTGGAGTEVTVNINGGVPYSDTTVRNYEIVLTNNRVEFWVDGVYQANIARDVAMSGLIKAVSLPIIGRLYNVGAPSSAPLFDFADISAIKIGGDDGLSAPIRQALMGKSSYYHPSDLTTTVTGTHNLPASGTIPTAATGSNTASVLNNTLVMGGFFYMNGATITATVHSTFWVSGFQNPAIPQAAGSANNARNFIVTGITVSPLVVSTVLVGGGFAANWFAAIGATSLTSATVDADGTTTAGTKTDRLVPLSRVTSFAAAAAVGTIETGAGDSTVYFPTPLVVHPGEFLKIGLRTFYVNAAVTSGVLAGSINVNGYWD